MNKWNTANLSSWLAEGKPCQIRNLRSPLHVHFLLTGSDDQLRQPHNVLPQIAVKQEMHWELEASSSLRWGRTYGGNLAHCCRGADTHKYEHVDLRKLQPALRTLSLPPLGTCSL